MKRRRKLLVLGKWASTALCVAVVAVWIRGGSYDFSFADTRVQIGSAGGLVTIAFRSPTGEFEGPAHRPTRRRCWFPVINNWTTFEFARASRNWPSLTKVTELLTPLWLPAAALAGLTVLLWRLDRRLPAPGHCLRCEYNLKGLTEARCPECGEPFWTRDDVR